MIDKIITHIKNALRKEHVAVIDEVFGTTVPGTDIDVFSFLFVMNTLFNDAEPNLQAKMRRWPLRKWTSEVKKEISVRNITPPPTAPTVPPVSGTQSLPKPPLSPPPSPPGTTGGTPFNQPSQLPIPAPPRYLTPVEREAWIQARVRGGEFARGLGNYIEETTGVLVREVWDKETAVQEGDLDKRVATIERIRTETADAVARGKTASELARALRNTTEDWGRNWRRIAKTELQGAYNEATVIDAIRLYGTEGLIARPPERTACVHCNSLLLDDDGRPKIFNVEELVNNGTNVGKPSSDWKPTVWPIHPNCKCGTQIIPPGFVFDEQWSLVRREP